MSKSTTKPTIDMTGQALNLPRGGTASLFVKGADLYETGRVKGGVTIQTDEGPVEGTIQGMQVGALIDLIMTYGPQNAYTYGLTYTSLGLIQAMTDASPEDVLDVTRIYTAVLVQIPMPSTTLPA